MSLVPETISSSGLGKLPVELVQNICHHLLEQPMNPQIGSKQLDLKSFQLTCKAVGACARPFIWQEVNIVFDEADLAHDVYVLQNLQGVVSSSDHPLFKHTRSIHISLPYYTIVTKAAFTDGLDIALSHLLSRSETLLRVQIDFAMVDHPISRFERTLNRIFEIQNLESLSILGLVSERPIAMQQASKITQLRVEQVGNGLPIDLLQFQHLSQLYLGIDCHYEELLVSTSLYFPPSLWSTLDAFVLELYGWEKQAEVVMRALATSVKSAEQTCLTKLGILLNIDDQGEEQLLEAFLQASPNIQCLALVIPELPTARSILELAKKCPYLCELTLCAHLRGGTWKWPDEAQDYAGAISQFPNLRRLAINHDDLATEVNSLGEKESFAKFTHGCSEEGAALRIKFCRDIASRSQTLEEISICPVEQEKSRLLIRRMGPDLPEVTFDDGVRKLFWELI